MGATTYVKSKVLPFRVKIQGLTLIGCAWQWSCWRHCFESENYLQGENPRSGLNWLCLALSSWRCCFWRIGHQVLFWWWLCGCCKDCNSLTGLFFFISSSYCLSAVCIRNSFGYCVVAEAGCNLYLRDINIRSLKKHTHALSRGKPASILWH